MTESNPRVRAAFRETKAEGGWGVVSTGAVSIHPSSDDSRFPSHGYGATLISLHTRYLRKPFIDMVAWRRWSYGTAVLR